MQTAWLQRANHPHCLLFFSGWGMDPEPFRFLPARSCDVLLVHDYRHLQLPELEPLAAYRQVHLAAWSMGVWVAAHLLADRAGSFASRTALAGTLSPIDAGRGLPPEAYATMVDSFGPEVLDTFYANMFDDPAQHSRFLASRPGRPVGRTARGDGRLPRRRPGRYGSGHLYQKNRYQPRPHLPPAATSCAPGAGTRRPRSTPGHDFPFFLFADWQDLLSA